MSFIQRLKKDPTYLEIIQKEQLSYRENALQQTIISVAEKEFGNLHAKLEKVKGDLKEARVHTELEVVKEKLENAQEKNQIAFVMGQTSVLQKGIRFLNTPYTHLLSAPSPAPEGTTPPAPSPAPIGAPASPTEQTTALIDAKAEETFVESLPGLFRPLYLIMRRILVQLTPATTAILFIIGVGGMYTWGKASKSLLEKDYQHLLGRFNEYKNETQDFAKLKEEHKTDQQTIAQLQKELKSEQEKAEENSRQWKEEKAALNKQFEASRQQYAVEIKSARENLSSATKAQISRLEEQNRKLATEKDTLSGRYQGREDEMARIQRERDTAREDLNSNTIRMAALQKETQSMREQKEEYRRNADHYLTLKPFVLDLTHYLQADIYNNEKLALNQTVLAELVGEYNRIYKKWDEGGVMTGIDIPKLQIRKGKVLQK